MGNGAVQLVLTTVGAERIVRGLKQFQGQALASVAVKLGHRQSDHELLRQHHRPVARVEQLIEVGLERIKRAAGARIGLHRASMPRIKLQGSRINRPLFRLFPRHAHQEKRCTRRTIGFFRGRLLSVCRGRLAPISGACVGLFGQNAHDLTEGVQSPHYIRIFLQLRALVGRHSLDPNS